MLAVHIHIISAKTLRSFDVRRLIATRRYLIDCCFKSFTRTFDKLPTTLGKKKKKLTNE